MCSWEYLAVLRHQSCKGMGRCSVQGRRAKQSVLIFPTVVKNQAHLLESKTIFFSERKMNCVLSYRIFPEEESKGKGCNLIG